MAKAEAATEPEAEKQPTAHPKDNPIDRAEWYLSRVQVHSHADLRNIVYRLQAFQQAGGQWSDNEHLLTYLSGLGKDQVGVFVRAWRHLQEASATLGGPAMPILPARPPHRPQQGAAPPWPIWRPTPALVEALRVLACHVPLRAIATRRWRQVWTTRRLVEIGVQGIGNSIQLVETGNAAMRLCKLPPEAMEALNTLAVEAGGSTESPAAEPYPNIRRILEIQPSAALISPVLWGVIPASAARLAEILRQHEPKEGAP